MNSNAVSVTVNSCTTGLKEHANQMLIYPNPSHGNFIVETSNLPASTFLVIFDQLGQAVYKQSVSKNVETIDVHLSAGIYTLKLQSSEGMRTYRLVIE